MSLLGRGSQRVAICPCSRSNLFMLEDVRGRQSRISLRHLYAVLAVFDERGIRPAAACLGRAYSAIARSVRVLEDQLQIALFERRGDGMLPTAAGQLVAARAALIENELAEVMADAQSLSQRNLGSRPGAVEALHDGPKLAIAILLSQAQSMRAVADALAITQPAVSAGIAVLEAALRQRLFERTGRGVVLTEAGRRWIPRFERVLVQREHIEEDISDLQGVVRGSVAIGAMSLGRTSILPSAIATVLKKHPALRVTSLESPYEDLVAKLVSGAIDFIFAALRSNASHDLVHEILLTEKIAVIARSDHPLAKKRRLSFADLQAYSWVLSRSGTPLRTKFDAYCHEVGVPAVVPSVETGDLALVRGLLCNSNMLTALSARQFSYELMDGRLCMLSVDTTMTREIGFIFRKDVIFSPGTRLLVAAIRAHVFAGEPDLGAALVRKPAEQGTGLWSPVGSETG